MQFHFRAGCIDQKEEMTERATDARPLVGVIDGEINLDQHLPTGGGREGTASN
jgi:hypothetical protein